jgi:hypothetical protein
MNTAPIFVRLSKNATDAAEIANDMPIDVGDEINVSIGAEITHVHVNAAAAQLLFITVGQGGL